MHTMSGGKVNHIITLTATPSLNKLHGNKWQMLNWKKKYLKELKGYEYVVGVAKGKRKVTVTRYGSRFLDIDNLWGSMKPLFDALKERKLIIDDNGKYLVVDFQPQEKVSRGDELTSIIIEDLY